MRRCLPLISVALLIVPLAAAGAACALPQDAAPVTAPPAAAAGPPFFPNYLGTSQMAADQHRWMRLPVSIYFDTEGSYTPEREQAVRAGFDEWSKATNGVLGYRVVNAPYYANVIVHFQPVAHLPEGMTMVGQTHTATRGIWLVGARMDLATEGNMTIELLTEVAAHEWGHALGIHGHSDDSSDLMYPTTIRTVSVTSHDLKPPSEMRTPTQRDLNTIKTIYADLFTPKQSDPDSAESG